MGKSEVISQKNTETSLIERFYTPNVVLVKCGR